MFFPITAPDGSEIYPIRNDGKEGRWRYGKQSSLIRQVSNDAEMAHWEKRSFDSGILIDGEKERWVPYEKVRDPNKASGWSTWLDNIATNADGTKALKEIFGEKVFETPKPVALIEWIISLSGNPDCIVLDSFAGSGTTAHAVMSLNKSDEGNRRFILVEFEDYADTITAERVRRVISGYQFKGVQREELFRANLTFTTLKKADKLLDQVQAIDNLESNRFDRIKKEVKGGELIVVGEKQVEERVEGLAGSFTFSSLGEPLDLDKLLTGEQLPNYAAIGAWLFHTATGEALSGEAIDSANWFLGESKGYYVWLIYKPDLNFLKSRDSALTLDLAVRIAKSRTAKRHLIFGPSKFVPNKMLLPLGVEYAPLPFALYKLEKDRANGA